MPRLLAIIELLKNSERFPLYKHQYDCLISGRNKENIFLTSPTSSGKTISFLLPIFDRIIQENYPKRLMAVIVYPTKALARNQFDEIQLLCEQLQPEPIRIAILDGNTGRKKSGQIDEQERIGILSKFPQIILTNLDFVMRQFYNTNSFSIKFTDYMKNFQFLIMDEAHKFTGTYGTKAHSELLNLRREYGKFQVIAASATIKEPKKFADVLFDDEATLIEGQGNRGRTTLSILYPGKKYTEKDVIIDLLGKFKEKGLKSIAFSNTRMGAEEIAIFGSKLGIKIDVHRAGLLHEDILEVEKNFKEKNSLGIIICNGIKVLKVLLVRKIFLHMVMIGLDLIYHLKQLKIA